MILYVCTVLYVCVLCAQICIKRFSKVQKITALDLLFIVSYFKHLTCANFTADSAATRDRNNTKMNFSIMINNCALRDEC